MIDLVTFLDRVHVLVSGELAFDMASWDGWNKREIYNCTQLALYEIAHQRELKSAARHRALALFRSWLSPDERAQLRVYRRVRVHGSAGGVYDVTPYQGITTRKLEQHGSRWYSVETFCLHDDPGTLPQPDIALAHLLLLKTDEPRFLATANITIRRPSGWRVAA